MCVGDGLLAAGKVFLLLHWRVLKADRLQMGRLLRLHGAAALRQESLGRHTTAVVAGHEGGIHFRK